MTSEQEEVIRLGNEKKEWISRGVSAEFEKKDKVYAYYYNLFHNKGNCITVLLLILKYAKATHLHKSLFPSDINSEI